MTEESSTEPTVASTMLPSGSPLPSVSYIPSSSTFSTSSLTSSSQLLSSSSSGCPTIKFYPLTACSGLDDSTAPYWLVVPKGGTNSIRVVVDPPGHVTVASADQAIATVSPNSNSGSDFILVVSGKAKGETAISIQPGNPNCPPAILRVSVKMKKEILVSFIFVFDFAGHHTTRGTADMNAMLSVMNLTWGKQANVWFTKKNNSIRIFQTDLGPVVDFPTDWNLLAAVVDPTADWTVFYVWEYEQGGNETDAGTLNGMTVMDDATNCPGEIVLAHEAGHFLGITVHNDAQTDNLMHTYNCGCVIRKHEADIVNP